MPDQDVCGNCGFIFMEHYFRLACPNVGGGKAGGTRGSFVRADGTEIFYNVWRTDEQRWNACAYERTYHTNCGLFVEQDPSRPFKLSLKEAEEWFAKMAKINAEIWEVRAIGPNNTSIPLSQIVSGKAKVTVSKTKQENSKEMTFFQVSLSPNSCSKCGAPRPCSYH